MFTKVWLGSGISGRENKSIKYDHRFKGELQLGGEEGRARGKGGGGGQTVKINIYAKLKRLNFIPQIVRSL